MADPTENQSVTQANRLSSPHHHKETHGRSNDIDESTPVDKVKGPNLIQRVKEEAIVQAVHPKDGEEKSKEAKGSSSSHHDTETHGRSNDIDEKTPVDEVKGPGVFSRMKEEVEAVFEAFHPKKDKDDQK